MFLLVGVAGIAFAALASKVYYQKARKIPEWFMREAKFNGGPWGCWISKVVQTD